MQRHQEENFLEILRQHVQQAYPAYAEVSPRIMTRLIGFGVERARDYGFTWQSTLGQFVYLMAAIAPNFDQHPALHAVLVNPAIPIEKRPGSLIQRLPAGVWTDAEATASTIGWFMIRDEFHLPPAERISSALLNALPDTAKIQSGDRLKRVEQSIRTAEALGFTAEDQQWVFVAASLHYGDCFVSDLAWAKETFVPAFPLQTQISLLRVRMALDAGIWI
ncbi:MAG: hypothetical protein ACU836_15730 [Gammaproteobacteria bacterium]